MRCGARCGGAACAQPPHYCRSGLECGELGGGEDLCDRSPVTRGAHGAYGTTLLWQGTGAGTRAPPRGGPWGRRQQLWTCACMRAAWRPSTYGARRWRDCEPASRQPARAVRTGHACGGWAARGRRGGCGGVRGSTQQAGLGWSEAWHSESLWLWLCRPPFMSALRVARLLCGCEGSGMVEKVNRCPCSPIPCEVFTQSCSAGRPRA